MYLAVDIRPRVNGSDTGAHVVELGLVNAQDEPAVNKDTAWLFQPKLTVTAAVENELAVFCPIDDPLDDLAALDGDAEDRQLRLLYRDELRHAVGRNVAVHAHVRAGERHAYRLETTWLPTYEVPATIAPPAEAGSHLAGVELSMDALATAPVDRLAAGLGPLAAGYSAWLNEQEARIAELPGALRETAETAIFTALQVRWPDPGRDRASRLVLRSRARGRARGFPVREPGDGAAAAAHYHRRDTGIRRVELRGGTRRSPG